MAAELARVGCAVTVLERSSEEPRDRGAGIGLPPSLVATLVGLDLVDRDLPRIDAHRFVHLVRDEREERLGHVLWDQSGRLCLLNWGALHTNLRRRVPEGAFRTSSEVIGLRETRAGTVEVELGDCRRSEFDLVVCADGYRSVGRRTLFPDLPVRYAGYVLWRGSVAESELPDAGPLEGAVCWPSYTGGHGPFYLVPGVDGSTERGKRLVNWGLHLSVFEVERAELLTGKNPPAYAGPLPAGREDKLKSWVPEVLPELYAEIVAKSRGTSVQMIYESTVPAYRKGRICLAGDAGALARPHTATGVLKGITDAVALGEALRAHETLEEALAHYGAEQAAFGNEQVRLAGQLGRALAAEIPDGAPDAAARSFRSVVTLRSEVFAS